MYKTDSVICECCHLHFQTVGFVYTLPPSKFLCVLMASLGKTFQSYPGNEPAVIGRRTTEGKLLRNTQEWVTMETRPCEVLLRSSPLQSPWRPWQRTEYSNLPGCLPWQHRQGHFGDSLGGLLELSSEGLSKSPLGGMLCANPAKQLIVKRSVQ